MKGQSFRFELWPSRRTLAAKAFRSKHARVVPSVTLADLVVLVSLFLILAKDYFLMTVGLRVEWIGIAMLLGQAAMRHLEGRQTRAASLRMVFVSTFVFVSWLGSSIVSNTVNSSSYYAAFVVALAVLRIQPRRFVLSLTIIVALNTLLQLLEAITGDFLFSYVDDEFEYDEKMLSTDDGSLRTKGLYGSPLNAISVAMSLCFLAPRSKINWVILCAASMLGQGRLGLGVGLLGLLVANLKSRTGNSESSSSPNVSRGKGRLIALLYLGGTALIVVGWAMFFGTDSAIERMLEAASANNSQNLSRLEFWTSSIVELMNYDLISLIFGRFGYIKALQGGTESDWLRMWLDNGVFFLGTVLFLVFSRLARALGTKDWSNFYASAICIFVMTVYPHAQSFPNGLLTWIFLLTPPRVGTRQLTNAPRLHSPRTNNGIASHEKEHDR